MSNIVKLTKMDITRFAKKLFMLSRAVFFSVHHLRIESYVLAKRLAQFRTFSLAVAKIVQAGFIFEKWASQ